MLTKKIQRTYIIFCILFFYAIGGYSQLTTPQVLSSNMVLQQGQRVPIWGKAEPKEAIQISFAGQRVKVNADSGGKWIAELQPMKASKVGQSMTIKGKKTGLVYNNILIGEVWLCGGQSNMEYKMKRIPEFVPPSKGADVATLELQKPANEMIRVFISSRDAKEGVWRIADSGSLAHVSAVGYFFGKAIQQKLDVPVGIISAAIGGTGIEAWTLRSAYEGSSTFRAELERTGRVGGLGPGEWYNKIIAPLVPFSVKGFLWYQGENNCALRDRQYAEKYQVMVEAWRKAFLLPEAPFYSVLLAPHIYSDRLHKGHPVTAEQLPIFRTQQIKGVSLVHNNDIIVITDLVDDLSDIHPPNKWDVGARLARLALAKSYGVDTIWCGPRLKDIERVADSVVLTFDYCGAGLKASDNKRLNWFEIADDDGIFHPALADIRSKDKVVVYQYEIKKPVAVRFGWHEIAVPNLVNSEGLPALPFNTDDYAGIK